MLARHSYDVPLAVVGTIDSSSRGWSSLDAQLVTVAGGTTARQVLSRPNVTMLVGAPLHTTVTCNGVERHRFQVPGQFDVLPPGATVSWVDRGASTFVCVDLDSNELMELEPLLGVRDARVEHLLWALADELRDTRYGGRLYAESLGEALIAHLLRKECRDRTLRRRAEPRIERVMDYVRDRLDADLSLVELAEIAGLSVSHFKAVFRTSVGVPVHRYVLRERVRLAARLLRNTALPLSDVALRAGFSHQSHMASALKRHLGVTPAQFRKGFP